MDKILISSCLVGDNTKYNGGNNLNSELMDLLAALGKFDLVPFCPEMAGGLPSPRKRSEIRADRIRDEDGKDVSRYFNSGAEKALALCRYLGINIAILKENSPSCGTHFVYNGLFTGTLVKGKGIASGRLLAAGIRVMNEEEAIAFLKEEIEKEEKGKIAKAAALARDEAKKEEESAETPKPEKGFEEKKRHPKPHRESYPKSDRGNYRKNEGERAYKDSSRKNTFRKHSSSHSYNKKAFKSK